MGPNYLQLPVNSAKSATVATNQRDGQMTYAVDLGAGQNPHVNFEPSMHGGLRESTYPTHDEQGPEISGRLTRKRLPRTNDYAQAADRYRTMMDWERDDLVGNLVTLLSQCERDVQERMVWHFLLVDDDYGNRVGEGLGIKPADVGHLQPLPNQQLTEEDQQRLANLGNAGPRKATGEKITGSVDVKRLADVTSSLAHQLTMSGNGSDANVGESATS